MICCYMAKRETDGFLDYRYISAVPVDTVGPRWEGWTLVPVEIREYDEKRKRLEDAAEDLLAACKEALDFLERHGYRASPVLKQIDKAIAKAEGKE